MTQPKTRILLTDPQLLATLKGLHKGADYVLAEPQALGECVSATDVLLLDDAAAREFLGSCPEERRPSVAVLAAEGDGLPGVYAEGLVDDLLVLPPRSLEIERLLRLHELVRALREVEHSSRSVTKLVRQIQEDLQLAEKVQRRLIREKFPALGPLSVKSKYWCGLKSGGDYFDVFELPGGTHAGVILSDASSYGLSTSLISSLMQFSLQVGQADLDDPARILSALFTRLRGGMREKDRLSILYGVLDRKTFRFRFVSCGDLYLLKKDRAGALVWAARGETAPLSLSMAEVPAARDLLLQPGERLLLASDGWGHSLGEDAPGLLERVLGAGGDGQDLVNRMAFDLRRKLEAESEEPSRADDDFPMPPEDCSVLLFELAANALRLAR